MKFYMNGLNSTNRTFRFLSNHACMNRGSTIGKNINYIMWKYDIPPKMCRGTYVAVNKLITKWYNNNIKTDDDINASIIAECIMIRDNTMTCNTMNQCDANDIVMYLTTMYLNCRLHHVLYFWCFLDTTSCCCTIMYEINNIKQYYYNSMCMLAAAHAGLQFGWGGGGKITERQTDSHIERQTNIHYRAIKVQ